jgi:hypothetical protein
MLMLLPIQLARQRLLPAPGLACSSSSSMGLQLQQQVFRG